MPTPSQRPRKRLLRKGHFACELCRSRKLRCDRPLPCTNCRTRNKICCVYENGADSLKPHKEDLDVSTSRSPATILGHADPARARNSNSEPDPTAERPHASFHEDLLAEIQTLRMATQKLEHRILQDSTTHQPPVSGFIALPQSSCLGSATVLQAVSETKQVGDVVAQLQRVSMGASSLDVNYSEDLVVKIEHIQIIPNAPARIWHQNKLLPCVWLPYHAEATILVDHYIEHLSYIQHVVHHPSISDVVNGLYQQVDFDVPLDPGSLLLVLSMIASATHIWTLPASEGSERSLLLTSVQVNAQTFMWVKAAYTVLNAVQDMRPTLKLIQGIIILSFIIANLEGVSMRYRSLISTGLLLGREMNLHRLDDKPDISATNIVEVEVSRRVWWYLSATDW
ncbi:hypothetical protein DE146DRAFT_642625 [Phaeosphaeria sp. MPI-PUGE-AT-0046c]|nr:hypothetical protein DE146DRAFT_642625 [Phaeosphaeria sp. MPI-PUGE-AT-0046c]